MIEPLKRLLARLDAWSREHRWSRVFRRAAIGFVKHEALQNAGAMAYFGILSVFQLLVLAVVALSYLLGEGEARQFVLDQVSGGSPIDADTVAAVIDAVIGSRGGIGLFGLVFLVWGALGLFSAVSKGIGIAFEATTPRPFIQDKLLGLLLMAITGVLGIASVVIGVVTGILQAAAGEVLESVPGGGIALTLIGLVLPLVLIFVSFVVLYRLAPNRRVTLAEVWPGALVAAVLWTVLRVGFTWYATSIARYDTAFGPISAGISLLVFLYFASVVVLLGAEIARAEVLEDEEDMELASPEPAAVAGPALTTDDVRSKADARRIPTWALAVGAAIAGLIVRRASSRRDDS